MAVVFHCQVELPESSLSKSTVKHLDTSHNRPSTEMPKLVPSTDDGSKCMSALEELAVAQVFTAKKAGTWMFIPSTYGYVSK